MIINGIYVPRNKDRANYCVPVAIASLVHLEDMEPIITMCRELQPDAFHARGVEPRVAQYVLRVFVEQEGYTLHRLPSKQQDWTNFQRAYTSDPMFIAGIIDGFWGHAWAQYPNGVLIDNDPASPQPWYRADFVRRAAHIRIDYAAAIHY